MELRLADVRLLVEDVERSVGFYRDVVGLPLRFHVEGVYAELEAGGAVLAVYRRELMREAVGGRLDEPGGERVVVTFDVDDVDEAYRGLVAGGATAVTEPHHHPVWEIRVAHLRDPEGNLFELDGRREPPDPAGTQAAPPTP